jgi:hypothetical protein
MNGKARRLWLIPLIVGLIVGVLVGYSARPATGVAAPGAAASSKCKTNSGPPPGSKHYTPGPKKGGVTPLPRATPVHPRPHLILGMITHPLRAVQTAQKGADSHNKAYTFYLVPSQVVLRTITKYGFKPSGVKLVSPPKPFPRYAGRPVRKAVVKYQNKLYQVRVAQPGRQGKTGIWLIVTILPQNVRLGGIGQPGKVVAHEQHLADTNKKYAFLLDPNQVVLKYAAQYGLVPPVKLVSRATPFQAHTGRPTMHAVVSASGVQYDVYVAQFGKHGAKGVWSYAFIDVHQA